MEFFIQDRRILNKEFNDVDNFCDYLVKVFLFDIITLGVLRDAVSTYNGMEEEVCSVIINLWVQAQGFLYRLISDSFYSFARIFFNNHKNQS